MPLDGFLLVDGGYNGRQNSPTSYPKNSMKYANRFVRAENIFEGEEASERVVVGRIISVFKNAAGRRHMFFCKEAIIIFVNIPLEKYELGRKRLLL